MNTLVRLNPLSIQSLMLCSGFECNFTEKYPSVEKQRVFLSAYLERSQGRPNVADNPTVESLMHEATIFSVVSHLYWGIWSIIQSRFSSIDFDFLSYAAFRLDHFHKGRNSILSEI